MARLLRFHSRTRAVDPTPTCRDLRTLKLERCVAWTLIPREPLPTRRLPCEKKRAIGRWWSFCLSPSWFSRCTCIAGCAAAYRAIGEKAAKRTSTDLAFR